MERLPLTSTLRSASGWRYTDFCVAAAPPVVNCGLVGRLTHRDYERVLDLTAAVVDGMAGDDPWFLVADQLNDCLRGTATIFEADLRPEHRASLVAAWAPAGAGDRPFEPRLRAHGGEHPLAPVFAGGELRPLTVDDVVDGRTWRRNSWYQATRRRFDGATRHIGLPLPAPPGSVRAFVVVRSGRDFGARERELALRVQPLLAAVDRHLRALRRIPEAGPDLGLTARELVVLRLLADGLTAAAVGRRLGISPGTVTKHQEHLYRKLGVGDRLSAVLLAQRLGALPPTPTRR